MRMSFGGVMNKFLGRSEKTEKFSRMQEDDRLQSKLEERKKNSNERELERFQEEDRQKMIKEQLEQFREHQKKAFWSSNIFKQDSILKDDNPILKQKKIFSMKAKGNTGGMFFK